MKVKNKKPTVILCFEDFIKSCIIAEKNDLLISNIVSPELVEKFIELGNLFGFELKITIFDFREYDPEFAETHIKNGTVNFKLNNKYYVKKQTYKFKSKNRIKYYTTLWNEYIDKFCNYTRKIKQIGLKYSQITYISYGAKSEIINLENDIHMSRQATYLNEKELTPLYIIEKEKTLMNEIKKLNIEPSGYYNYDEEFIKINKEIYVRLTLIDAHTRMIINDELIPKNQFNKFYIEKFLNESTEGIELNTIITDGHSSYREIIDKLGAKHQLCTFHLMHNLMADLNPTIHGKNRKIESLKNKNMEKNDKIEELKNKQPLKRGRKKKTDTQAINNLNQRKKLTKEIRQNNDKIRKYKAEIKELLTYKKKIQKVFKAKTLKTALKHFNELKEKLEELPEVIKEFVKKLDKKIDRVLEQVKDRKIPKTNNLVELFFKVTFPGKIKRIYRTYEGALNKIKLDNLRWIETNVIEYHKKIKLIS
jgi:hypothetical protein